MGEEFDRFNGGAILMEYPIFGCVDDRAPFALRQGELGFFVICIEGDVKGGGAVEPEGDKPRRGVPICIPFDLFVPQKAGVAQIFVFEAEGDQR